MNPRTPILAGWAAITSRDGDPTSAPEALDLAVQAARTAGEGIPTLLRRVGLVLVPKGIWGYEDPARAVARAIGADARTVLAEIGVLQQTLISRACDVIAAGEADAVLVVGAEAKHRAMRAAIEGVAAPESPAPGPPDELLAPDGEILTRAEIERDLAVPAHQYAIVENALAHADGLTVTEQVDRLGRLWQRFAAVAATRSDAWDRTAPTAAEITTPGPGNRLLAFPYTKRLCSQWNVDQAVALLFTSAGVADDVGVERDRRVYPVVGAESNHMSVVPARAELHRAPAVTGLVEAVRAHTGIHPAACELVDLYSCFPAAVQVQAREIGLDVERDLTVTGGMTFAGGPLNSYSLHATAQMADELLAHPGATGLVTAVSGMLTKVGLSLWSSSAPEVAWASLDVTEAAREATDLVPYEPHAVGRGTIVGATVVHEQGDPARIAAVVELSDHVRTVAVQTDAATATAVVGDDLCGLPVFVPEPGVLAFG